MSAPRPFSVRIRWGTEATRAEMYSADPEDAAYYDFATEAELAAFLLGVAEGDGWLDYEIVQDEETE